MEEIYIKSFNRLKNYCEKNNFRGYDPYDGLNSKVFNSIPFIRDNRFFRLAWIQFFKKSPINFRKIMLVEKGYNPKAIGLFLQAYSNLYLLEKKDEYFEKIKFLSNLLIDLKTPEKSGACWGYNFDWQARAFYLKKGTPTVVATSFIGSALISAYNITKDENLLKEIISIKDFILNDLNRTYDDDGDFSFSYSPLDKTTVFNASLLGAKILCEIYSLTNKENLITTARKAVSFAVKRQKEDGSWSYGTLPYHYWIDNFHTGYNLEAIYEYQKISKDLSFSNSIEKGFSYYVNNFFTNEGISKYYNNSIYPIDIHAPSELTAVLYKLDRINEDLLEKVLKWTIENMQDKKEGFFYYQIKKNHSSKIPYMRWAQSWMFYGFSYYFLGQNR